MQMLWINVIPNGPPALALSLDRNHDLMGQRPRDPNSPLLDAASVRFIFIVGAASALIGGLLLVLLPRFGYGIEASRTLLFLYATISQLVLAYSARRIISVQRMNIALHLSVVLCFGLQLMTVVVPGLRFVLGLELPDRFGLLTVAGAILVSWGAAEIYVRLPILRFAGPNRHETGSTTSLDWIRRIIVAIVGFTVLLIGVALLVLPGPAFIVIPLGLAILATEFVWARALLKKARDMFPKTNRSKPDSLRHKMN